MDVVLGVSVTTAAVSMVLIEGEKADGVSVESATLDTVAVGGAVKASPSEQISAAILATQRNALSNGHHLVATGVTWVDEQALETMSDSVAARDLHNVVLMTEQNAVGALAQTIGRALGYHTTAVILMNPDTATLSLVDSDDGSIVEVRTCSLNRAKATDFLPAMAASLETRSPRAGGVFVVGSASWVTSVKSSLERLIPQPVIVPEEPELALARGAALAAANAPVAEASTCGLAYSQDPDELAPVKLADADTQAAPLDYIRSDDVMCSTHRGADPRVRVRADPRARMPIGSAAAAALVTGAVTVAMLVAANVSPDVDRDSTAAGVATAPSALAPEPPAAQSAGAIPAGALSDAQPQQQPPAPPSIPVATPTMAQPPPAPPLQAPPVQTRAPVVQIRAPVPSRVIAQPAPVAVEKPLPAMPAAAEPELAEALPVPGAAAAPPVPISTPPSPRASSVIAAPAVSTPAQAPQFALSPWPPSFWIGTTPSQLQASQPLGDRQWVQIPLMPQQQGAQPPQAPSPGLQIAPGFQIVPPPRRQAPQPQWTPSQVPQWTPSQVPQWTPSQVPQWTPALPSQLPQSAAPRSPYPTAPRSEIPWPTGISGNTTGTTGTTASYPSLAQPSGADPRGLWPYQ